MKTLLKTLLLLFPLFLSACLEKVDPALEEDSFFRIYDDADFSASFSPLDVQQTVDEGYLILASKRVPDSNFAGVYILKVDKTGAILNEPDALDPQYVNPIGPLMLINGAYHFVCMDSNVQEAQLVKITADGDLDIITPLGLTYPVASSLDGSTILLLSYNNGDKEMQISQLSAAGSITAGPLGFSIGVGDETEEPIINHFLQGGRKFPFAVGRIPGGSYYFNGFYNYTFSLVFTNFAGSDPTGIVYGQQENGGFSAIHSLGGSKFAAARFNFGDNYLHPNTTLATTGITIGTDLTGNTLPELAPNAAVKLISVTAKQKTALVFGSNTQSKQIALLFYNESDGVFLNSRYIGFSNPFEIGSMIQTSDEGLVVCGITYLAGRFPRICLVKLSKEEVENLVSQ